MTDSASRRASAARQTAETDVRAELSLDGGGESELNTGLPFFDHMLAQTARHGGLFVRLHAKGDLHVDGHHTVEDCGIVLGQALEKALGDKSGIARFGSAFAPLDESLSRAVVDLSGRPSLSYHANLARPNIGGMDAELLREFFQALTNHAKLTLHLDLLRGINAHHQAESMFKAFGLALKMAAAKTGGGLPSTKGVL
ncbi:MAG: imidazoleglycerol-phosphate dehydratase HisB [Gammaproteobacteria bacterium]